MIVFNELVNGIPVTAAFSEESVQEIWIPLLQKLAALQKEKGSRVLCLIAAPPATGKSTLVAFLKHLSETSDGLTPVDASGMDGFHRYESEIQGKTTLVNGKEVPLLSIKGAPITFDVVKLRDSLSQLVNSESPMPWPVYDRMKHDPVEGAVTLSGSIVIIEGNYFLLDDPAWAEIRALADYTVRISAEENFLKSRLLERKTIECGGDAFFAEEFVERSDMANVRLCLTKSLPGDLNIDMRGDGEFK